MGSKADGLNLSETTSNALGSTGGGQPKPIRKRGYYRALKSKKQWALSKKSWSDILNNVCVDMYAPAMNAYILTDNPLLKLQGLSAWLSELTVPINYFGVDRSKSAFRLSEEYKPVESFWSRIKAFF